MDKPRKILPNLDKDDIQILIQLINQPRQQDLQTATRLIQLSNKLSQMLGGAK